MQGPGDTVCIQGTEHLSCGSLVSAEKNEISDGKGQKEQIEGTSKMNS